MSRDAVIKLYTAGRSHAEIGAELGISKHASEQHVYAARKSGALPPAPIRERQSWPGAATDTADHREHGAAIVPVASSARLCSKCKRPGHNARGCDGSGDPPEPSISLERRDLIAQHQTRLARDRAGRTQAAKASIATSDEDEEPAAVDSIVPDALEIPAATAGRLRRTPRAIQPRSASVAPRRMLRTEAIALNTEYAVELAEIDRLRPKTRADCVDGVRPCPWISCRHHLAIDINPETGSLKLNRVDIEPWALVESCALDVADRGDHTLEAVGLLLNVTRERLRQIETAALSALRGKRVVKHGIGPGPFVDRQEDVA